MTKIYLTRHGETEWNTQRRMQGWLDSPLTEQGKFQARCLGDRLATVLLSAIYPSVAPRAIATAELICGARNIPIQPQENLKEMGLGEWEGCLVEDLLRTEKENCQNFFYYPDRYTPPKGAENFDEVRQRIDLIFNELVEKHRNESILIVTHGVFMRNILAYLRKKPIREVWSELYKPTALSLAIEEDGCFEIEYWNDTAHYKTEVR